EAAPNAPGDTEPGGGVTQPPLTPQEPKPRPFKLEPSAGGFRITSNPDEKRQIERFDIEVAYAVRAGNAFKRYSPFDFDLNAMKFRGEGVRIAHAREN